jgi:hypothetical protein
MCRSLSGWIQRVSTGKVALVFLLIFLIFMAVVLPDQASKASQATGDADSPDTSFFYSSADLYRMAEAYGQSGRDAYVRARFTFDLVWPLVYTAFLCTSLSWLNRKAFSSASPWQRTNLVPLLAFLFDLLENISTSLVMSSYPSTVPLAAALAPFFTLFKWIFLTASFILLLVTAGLALWRWLSPRLHRGS